jgi:hypothetical protein
MLRNSKPAGGWRPPIHVGARPRILLVAGLAAAVGGLGVACQSSSSDQVTQPIDLGMTSSLTAYYSDQNATLYQVQTPVQLPVKKPSSADIHALGAAPAGTPYPNAPWLTAGDELVEVRYTISNIDNQDHNVWLCVDPWNEFVRWVPGVSVVSDEETTPNYGYDLYFPVPAMSRVQGTLTTDDMHEIAIKLASTMNMLNSPQAQAAAAADAGTMDNTFNATGIANNIFNPQNRSNGGDPVYTPWIPPVIAGLTGFDLGLRTTEQANIEVEIVVDIQDVNGNRFVPADSTQPQLGPPPATLSPPGAKL